MIVKVCNPQPMTLAPVLKESQKRDKSIPSSWYFINNIFILLLSYYFYFYIALLY